MPGDLFVVSSAWKGKDKVWLCDGPGVDYDQYSVAEYGTIGIVISTSIHMTIGEEALVVLSTGRTGWMLAESVDVVQCAERKRFKAVKVRGPLV